MVACLIKRMCMLTNSLTASNYAIGAKGRYLCLWVLAGSGYLWVAGSPYEMRGGCGYLEANCGAARVATTRKKDTSSMQAYTALDKTVVDTLFYLRRQCHVI